MGLDITAYQKLEKQPKPDGDPYEAGPFWAHDNPHFPGRSEGVEDDAFYSYADAFGFRAGSYSGYGQWRNALAVLAGWNGSEAVWDAPGGPFWELINFADNEGVIGPVVAAKLAKDFAEFQPKADAHEDPYFRAKYAEWRKAFDMAADGGAVDFH